MPLTIPRVARERDPLERRDLEDLTVTAASDNIDDDGEGVRLACVTLLPGSVTEVATARPW